MMDNQVGKRALDQVLPEADFTLGEPLAPFKDILCGELYHS